MSEGAITQVAGVPVSDLEAASATRGFPIPTGTRSRSPSRRSNSVPGDMAPPADASPVRVRTPDGGDMFASFDTPFEVTTSELAVELLFPADRTTAERLHDRESGASRG